MPAIISTADPDLTAPAPRIADTVLAEALRLDRGRPRDDATVVVAKILPGNPSEKIRRLTMRFPI
jgi:hypothetical protein